MEVLQVFEESSKAINPKSVENVVRDTLHFLEIQCDEVSIHFVSDTRIRELHQQFFGDPSTTDCISFPMLEDSPPNYKIFGEVFICPETAEKACSSYETTLEQELTLYLIHGLLHLAGFKDSTDDEAKTMRQMETKTLAHLSKTGAHIALAEPDSTPPV